MKRFLKYFGIVCLIAFGVLIGLYLGLYGFVYLLNKLFEGGSFH